MVWRVEEAAPRTMMLEQRNVSQTVEFKAAPLSSTEPPKTLKLEINSVHVEAWPRGLPAGGGGGRTFGS